MSENPVKQKIVDKLKDSETVLVTVSSNPSVDELSAALGFTLLLNKMNKHATAVFSGDIPPAITFLDPEKTFENTVDSLRDFIIALDKERADHLRYKVEGDMVKIFITPYRTTIDQDDFEFSQGDYNVEMVVAIGVESEDDLDRALAGHGRILHDATVASLSVGDNKSELGTITWHDDKASSYSEMCVSLAESLKGSKNPIDEQIATAFLTGIVAATERFSNPKTTANAMTMAATLMAAGANQQLIATKLEEAEEAQAPEQDDKDTPDSSDTSENKNKDDDSSSMLKVERDEEPAVEEKLDNTPAKEPVQDKPAADGSMAISHQKHGTVDEVAEQVAREDQKAAAERAEAQLASSLASTQQPSAAVSVADLQQDLKRASEEVDDAASGQASTVVAEPMLPAPVMPSSAVVPTTSEPRMGGTLNATSEQAAEDKRRELENDRNKTILSHDTGRYLDAEDRPEDPSNGTHNQTVSMTAADIQSPEESTSSHEASQRGKTIMPSSVSSSPDASSATEPSDSPTLDDIDAENRGQDAARSEIEQALEQNSTSGGSLQPGSSGKSLPPLPPMPDFSTLPDLPPSAQDDLSGFISTPLPQASQPAMKPVQQQPEFQPVGQPAPQMQSFQQPTDQASFQPPVAAQTQIQQEQNLTDRLSDILPPAQPQQAPLAPQSQDPAQFQIPN